MPERDPHRDVLMTRVGTNIRRAREAKGLTQTELATELRETQTAISKWEAGKRMPRPGTLMRLARRLDVTVPDFYVPLEDEHTNGDPKVAA